jgi:dipeptidyl aminopeptidase/acylaminoacyl peptidase
MKRTRSALPGLAAALALCLADVPASGESGVVPYKMPPKVVADMVDAPPTPGASLSPDRKHLLLVHTPAFPSIAEVAAPELRLAGLRIDPRTTGPSRRTFANALSLVDPAAKQADAPRPVSGLPAGARIADVRWAPDGSAFAFTVSEDDGVALWVASPAAPKARKLTDKTLAGVLGAPCVWAPDARSLWCRFVPDGRGAAPAPPAVPAGPIVQEAAGRKAPARTYQDLLASPHDEALFEHYARSQIARVGLDGARTPLGAPDLFDRVAAAPDGKHLLVSVVHRPFSYRVPLERFPRRTEIWDPATGKKTEVLADVPLQEEVPVDFAAVPTGPRAFEWRADADATVCWVEARDGGDPKRTADVRDELLCLAAPFTAKKPTTIARLALRYGGTSWGTGTLALVHEWWWTDRKTRTWIVQPDRPKTAPQVLWDRSSEDRYGDPGRPLLTATGRGTWVLARAGGADALWLFGDGASPEGDRPFVDKLDLATRKSERLWRSEAPYFEQPYDLLDEAGGRLLTSRESVAEPPQYGWRALPGAGAKGFTALTRFPHPSPQLAKVQKQLIRYKRADGVELTGMLYLPPGFRPGKDKPLPMLMWAYPAEFKSKDAAGQVTDSPHRFARVWWGGPLWAVALGYAVLDDPTMPIVGEGDVEPNDTFVTQLVAGARAAVDEVVRLGAADRERIAIGGHSYGAFMTANLLAHSDIFRTGIARSGAYNRTLTPFGFQAEERLFWQAKATYVEMSPFTHADRIDEPILMIHGQADNNSGTFPIQSERLFEALKGLGGTARLVMLPAESHGYRARESVMHVLWEMATWLDTHVKKAKPRGAVKPKQTPGTDRTR